jgi:membrane-associated phospholipid phosphatase
MSTAADASRVKLEAKRRYAAAAFVALLVLSVFWPSPIVSANRLLHGPSLAVDDLSFLGREAPSWDVVFWCLAVLLLLAILHTAEGSDYREAWRQLRAVKLDAGLWKRGAIGVLCGCLGTLAVWLLADVRLMALSERLQSDWTEDVIRILNRLGGGMNPLLLVLFFLVAGVAYLQPRWISYAVAMAIAGLVAGIGAQLVKLVTGRARPELWLGAARYAPGSSTSFPSGHTVGAFALAGVLVFASPNRTLRIVAFVLATAIGVSRILAFRHWPSDVFASASVGIIAAWLACRAVKLSS